MPLVHPVHLTLNLPNPSLSPSTNPTPEKSCFPLNSIYFQCQQLLCITYPNFLFNPQTFPSRARKSQPNSHFPNIKQSNLQKTPYQNVWWEWSKQRHRSPRRTTIQPNFLPKKQSNTSHPQALLQFPPSQRACRRCRPRLQRHVFGPNNKFLGPYVLIGALIGLFLPIAYICEGIFKGDKEGIKAAAPHLFLLSSQVFMEGVTFSGKFSLPIRVFVPVFYNSRRIFTIVDWLRSEISKVDEGYGGSARRLSFGRGIAIANMAFWCFNLFGFLLPVYLPKAFKIYYSGYKVKN
ncbi:hypothetical protein F0562_031225 [Nyssa sinensis]|uniref:DUF7733 domain-containing protein n=1 Tax=Nyssa sinensis TaxID=561372 RepID=A0A5J5ATN4_9ASTE|nr:hypothetical protein F0562_031225 [Nyssa sinensis]